MIRAPTIMDLAAIAVALWFLLSGAFVDLPAKRLLDAVAVFVILSSLWRIWTRHPAAPVTDAPLSAPGAGIGRSGRVALGRLGAGVAPILAVVAALVALWSLACVPMNAQQSLLEAERAEIAVTPPTAAERRDLGGLSLALANPGEATARAFAQERPRLPAPHQVAAELWDGTVGPGRHLAPQPRLPCRHHARTDAARLRHRFGLGYPARHRDRP